MVIKSESEKLYTQQRIKAVRQEIAFMKNILKNLEDLEKKFQLAVQKYDGWETF